MIFKYLLFSLLITKCLLAEYLAILPPPLPPPMGPLPPLPPRPLPPPRPRPLVDLLLPRIFPQPHHWHQYLLLLQPQQWLVLTNVSLPTNNTIPSCTLTPSNYTCKICIGNHCRMFTESEQAAYRGIIITISILTMLVTSSCVIYYVFFEYLKNIKIGEVELNDIVMFSDSDDEEYAKNNSGVDV